MPDASTLAAVGLGLVLLPVVLALASSFLPAAPTRPTRSVALLVLGDLGRSPRMMYHSLSFLQQHFHVSLIGYPGSALLPALLSHPAFTPVYLPLPLATPRWAFVVAGPVKVIWQCAVVLWVLMTLPDPPEFILVQNPPSIPTLALAQLTCHLRGSKLIVDWHNLGFSILSLKLSARHPFVSLSIWYERFFGHKAYAHLFVTKAMRNWVVSSWGLEGKLKVLHDRPPEHFQRSDEVDAHSLFCRLFPTLSPVLRDSLPPSEPPQSSPMTELAKNRRVSSGSALSPADAATPRWRDDRPTLVVSSTSWTPDEDFDLLLDALSAYEGAVKAEVRSGRNRDRRRKVWVIISGKGPMREAFEREAERRRVAEKWTSIGVCCVWLAVEEYPVLLGSADLGVSLHQSSSKLDLPMKVVDMFGCGLPVLARDFDCLHELVKEGENGCTFSTATQLADQLLSLLKPSDPRLEQMRKSIEASRHAWGSWRVNWDRVVRPLVVKGAEGGVEVTDEASAEGRHTRSHESRDPSQGHSFAGSKAEDEIDPGLSPSLGSQANDKGSTRHFMLDRAAAEEKRRLFRTLDRTFDMLHTEQQRCKVPDERVEKANERERVASDRAAAKKLEASRLQEKVERLQRALDDEDERDDERVRKRARTTTQEAGSVQASSSTLGHSQPVTPSQTGKVAELEAKVLELEQAAVAARRTAEETLATRDARIVELETREREAVGAGEAAQGTIKAELEKIERQEEIIENLELSEKRLLVAGKKLEECETEIAELKALVAELERAAPAVPGPCTNAAHATALAAVDRLTLKAERLQKEHDAIAQMRGTLEGWMTNIAKIRALVASCSGSKPSKDVVSLHKWVINQAETMEELCGELTWAQSENDAAGPAN